MKRHSVRSTAIKRVSGVQRFVPRHTDFILELPESAGTGAHIVEFTRPHLFDGVAATSPQFDFLLLGVEQILTVFSAVWTPVNFAVVEFVNRRRWEQSGGFETFHDHRFVGVTVVEDVQTFRRNHKFEPANAVLELRLDVLREIGDLVGFEEQMLQRSHARGRNRDVREGVETYKEL